MKNNRRTGAILCPNCGKLVNADAAECIHCGYKKPGRKGIGTMISSIFGGNIGVIQMISFVCIALYVISLIVDPSALLETKGIFDFLSPGMASLDRLGMTGTYAMSHGRWWTLITAIYLHGGLLHILFNVLWIRNLGPVVEELFGMSRLILIFTLSGIAGFFLSNLFGINFTIGASGSIFGLLGALIYYGRDRGGIFGQAMFRQLMSWAIMLFVFGFIMPGINNFGHAGGFIGGYLSGMLLSYQEKKRETPFIKNLATAAVIITVVSFLLAVWTGFFK